MTNEKIFSKTTPNINDEEIRIAKVFRLAHGSKLPDVSKKSLTIYRDYLSKHLNFPVKVLYAQNIAPFKTTRWPFTVTNLLDLEDSDDPEFYGLFCQGTRGRQVLEMPLATIEVVEDGNNYMLIDDYKTWFENYR